MPDTAPLVFLDCETTSLNPDRRVWEVGMIRREGGREREIMIQVLGVDLSTADPMSLKIGRFYDRHVDYAHGDVSRAFSVAQNTREMPEVSAASEVEKWTRGAHIVGAVPNFDAECLAAMLRRHQLVPAWHYHLIDVENVAVGWLRKMREEVVDSDLTAPDSVLTLPWKSDDLSRACGVEPPSETGRHTAMGDARWAMRWYDKLTGSGTR